MLHQNIEEIVLNNIEADVLQIFYDEIKKAVVTGMHFAAQNPQVKKRTISCLDNDNMSATIISRLKKLGYPRAKVNIYTEHGSSRISFNNGAVIVRFKKMNNSGQTSNITTQSVLDFETQQDLFNEVPSIHISVGYTLINNGVDFMVMMSHPNNIGKVDWSYSIPQNIGMAGADMNDADTLPTMSMHRKAKLRGELTNNEEIGSKS